MNIKSANLLLICVSLLITCVKCFYPAKPNTKEWWQKTVFYQIYPRSFMDTNGDGIGDLKGITMKLEHLKYTGIEATWLSPIFESPMVDFGYDISDFKKIHHEYGTMDDFEEMIAEAKRLEIKVVLDFVPNHSSDQCDWFKKSVDRISGYEDFYVWHDGVEDPENPDGKRLPPNNWVSVFYGPAWTWNEKRQQFYLHQFTKQQPDLNYRNPRVVEEMRNVLKFWLDKGVDGFRVDAINHMFEVTDLRDEPVSGSSADPNSYEYLDHIYTKDLLETYEMVYSWRNLLDEHRKEHGGEARIMMTEAYANITFTMKFYESDDGNHLGSHMPFNFLLITDLDLKSDARDFVFTINKWLNYMPAGGTPNWVLGNHDRKRVGSRYGVELIDVMNMLLLTLPGIPVSYNGDEIGMLDYDDISWEDTKDPAACNTNPNVYKLYTRDPERTPIQWDDTMNAGFSTASETWLPVNPNYKDLNLKRQKNVDRSHYKTYKELVEFRQSKILMDGSFKSLALSKNVLAYSRELSNNEFVLIVLNLRGSTEQVNLSVFDDDYDKVEVLLAGSMSHFKKGDELDAVNAVLGPYESLILSPKITQRTLNSSIVTNNWIGISALLGIFVIGFLRYSNHGYNGKIL